MPTTRIPLSEQEEAHIALILDVHKAELAQIADLQRKAETRKAQLFAPLMKAHQIPDGTSVNVLGRENGAPAFLVYDAPDIPAGPPRPDADSRSEKSTDALASQGA